MGVFSGWISSNPKTFNFLKFKVTFLNLFFLLDFWLAHAVDENITLKTIKRKLRLSKPIIQNPRQNIFKDFEAFLTCSRIEMSKSNKNRKQIVIYVSDDPKSYKGKIFGMHKYMYTIENECKLGCQPRTQSPYKSISIFKRKSSL